MYERFLKRIASATLCIFFLQTTLWGAELPYFAPLSGLSSGASAAAVVLTAPSISYQSHLGVSSNKFRGDFGEAFMRYYFTEGGDFSPSKKWYAIEPGTVTVGKDGVRLSALGRPSRNGIDGLFVQYDSRGNPKSILVAESKFGSSQLGMTKDGKQMSIQWIQKRLVRTAEHHARIKMLLERGRIQHSPLPPSSLNVSRVTTIPLSQGQDVKIWWDTKSKSYVFYSEKPFDQTLIIKQLNKHIGFLEGAASGKIPVDARLFHISVDKAGVLKLEIKEVASSGNTVSVRVVETISGKMFSQLSLNHQGIFRKALVEIIANNLQSQGLSANEAVNKAEMFVSQAQKEGDKAVADLVARFSNDQRWGIQFGMKEGIKAGLFASGLATAFIALHFLWQGDFSWRGALLGVRDAAITGGAVSVGVWGGHQVSFVLKKGIEYFLASPRVSTTVNTAVCEALNRLGGIEKVSTFLGGFAGGILTSAILAYGSALLGFTDLKSANRMMLTGAASTAAGLLAGSAIMGTVMTFGTASTGTAIASLYGITATKAALAWLGGGAVAAGGFGITGGAIVLSGGVALVGIAVFALMGPLWRSLDRAEELRRVESLVSAYR